MKTNFTHIVLAFIWIFVSMNAFSQTSENLNSRAGVDTSSVKNYLQGKCWQFPGFDINTNGFVPNIEGDGAMVSEAGISSTQNSGIYTPVLDVWGSIPLSFNYKFNHDVTSRRWLKIYLTQPNNMVIQLLDSIELTNLLENTLYHYNQTLPAGSGGYKIYINYQGQGGDISIGIDELHLGTSQYYSSGCNEAPVSVPDAFSGTASHTATGNVLSNDYDPNMEAISSYLLIPSPDGTVNLSPTGYFTFTPNVGFTGPSTSFSYNACDYGFNPMCSEPTTVTMSFNILPVTMINFMANYNDNAVVINWTTTYENNNARFEIERSIDGVSYEKKGTVNGQGTSGIKHQYTFTDKVPEKITANKDLYYRLKQIDLDGSAAFSKVLIVRVYQTRSLQMVSVTPNPVKNDIKVNVQLKQNSYIVMKVVNSSGNEITRKSTKGNQGENSTTLEGTSHLPKGLYFLEVIINSNERMMVKIIKD